MPTFRRWLAERDHRFDATNVTQHGTPRQPDTLQMQPVLDPKGILHLSLAHDMAAVLIRYFHRNVDEQGVDQAWKVAAKDAYEEFRISLEEGMSDIFATTFLQMLRPLCGGQLPDDPSPGDQKVQDKVAEACLAAVTSQI